MNIERLGGCVCGSVRYATVEEPERVTVCHCRWCQRRTGTAFGTEVVFRKDQVVLSGVQPSCYRHISDESGRWLEMYFCPQCGTNLGLTVEAVPDLRTVPAGTYDAPEWLDAARPLIRHIFVRSRRNWGELSSEVEVYERHFR